MKSKLYKFDPVIYPFPLLVSKDWDEEEMKKHFYYVNDKESNIEITDELQSNGCTTARILSLCDKETMHLYFVILLFRPKIVRYGIITHESIHMANAYLQYLGVGAPQAWNDEEYAYFGGWVANCIWSVKNGDPDLMKGVLYEPEEKK